MQLLSWMLTDSLTSFLSPDLVLSMTISNKRGLCTWQSNKKIQVSVRTDQCKRAFRSVIASCAGVQMTEKRQVRSTELLMFHIFETIADLVEVATPLSMKVDETQTIVYEKQLQRMRYRV